MLRKGIYPYEYIGEWKKFNETALPEKEDFYSDLNMENITDADDIHTKKISNDFEIKNLRERHDLHLKVIHYYWQMFLKNLEKCVYKFTRSTRSCKISLQIFGNISRHRYAINS